MALFTVVSIDVLRNVRAHLTQAVVGTQIDPVVLDRATGPSSIHGQFHAGAFIPRPARRWSPGESLISLAVRCWSLIQWYKYQAVCSDYCAICLKDAAFVDAYPPRVITYIRIQLKNRIMCWNYQFMNYSQIHQDMLNIYTIRKKSRQQVQAHCGVIA